MSADPARAAGAETLASAFDEVLAEDARVVLAAEEYVDVSYARLGVVVEDGASADKRRAAIIAAGAVVIGKRRATKAWERISFGRFLNG